MSRIPLDDIFRQAGKLDIPCLREWAGRIAEGTGMFEVPATIEKLPAEQGLGAPQPPASAASR